MIRVVAWIGQKIGEAAWWLLHTVFEVDPPDFDQYR